MSRIGRLPVPLPQGVELEVKDREIAVSGPRGSLRKPLPGGIRVRVEDGQAKVERSSDNREVRALHGLTRKLLENMVTGVTQGFEKQLEISGVGYRAQKQGNVLELQLGFSRPLRRPIPEDVEIEVPAPNRILVRGTSKERVGQIASEIRNLRPPEPYKGKGIRYQDERVVRKPGKAAKAAG